jgi:hypothetical protein
MLGTEILVAKALRFYHLLEIATEIGWGGAGWRYIWDSSVYRGLLKMQE